MNTDASVLDLSSITLLCRRCSRPIEWGQSVCPTCGTQPVTGLPAFLDHLVMMVIYLIVVFVVFGILTWLVGNEIPQVVRIVVAALIVLWKIGLSPDLSFYPRAAWMKLAVRRQTDSDSSAEEKPFDFTVAVDEWRNTSAGIDDLDRVFEGLFFDQARARVCGLLPSAVVADRLIKLSQSSDRVVRTEALRSMIRLRDPCFAPRMKELLSDGGIQKVVRQEAQDSLASMEEM